MSWTEFMDMHSGGDTKWKTQYIYVEADDALQAREIFERVTKRRPDNITCWTCGEDYSISHADKLTQFGRTDLAYQSTFLNCKGEEIPFTSLDKE